MFRDGECGMVLPSLWSLHQAEPDNLDVTQLFVDGYWFLAVRDLQRGAAANKLGEVADLAPDDPAIARNRKAALAYKDREKELQYRIYVKCLPIR